MLTRTVNIADLTPEEMATIFCEADHIYQAAFFNRVGMLARSWGAMGWCGQASEIVPALDPDGSMVIAKIADHYAAATDWRPSA